MTWITVDCELPSHPKLARLPNDQARYGWIRTLLEAKKQRQQGSFASAAHFRLVLGRHGRYLPAYLAAGLLDPMGDRLDVHDWADYQRSVDRTGPERSARYRERHGGERDGARGSSRDASRLHERAGGVPPVVDVTESTSDEDSVLAYLASLGATIRPDGNGYHRELVQFVGRRGPRPVIAALEARYAAGDRSARQLLYGAMNDLEQIHRPNGAKAKGMTANTEDAERAFKTA